MPGDTQTVRTVLVRSQMGTKSLLKLAVEATLCSGKGFAYLLHKSRNYDGGLQYKKQPLWWGNFEGNLAFRL